ncbi:MAG: DNA-directed RNA polymerase subunit omega [Gemmatimonadota bacterium]|jgi:DNA-directed RNA polymerase subunit K/omega
MRVFVPKDVAKNTGSKYLGVLVAAKYARELNALPREAVPEPGHEKLTTRALGAQTGGDIEFRLINRRKKGL